MSALVKSPALMSGGEMKTLNKKIAIIGCGNLGSALVRGIVRAGVVAPELVTVVDANPQKMSAISKDFGVAVADSVTAAVSTADVVVVAVKPRDLAPVLVETRTAGQNRRPLIISVAAGVPVARLRSHLGADMAIARVMPNIPSIVGKGVSAIFMDVPRGPGIEEATIAETIFSSVGVITHLKREDEIDVVTALSSGGPAFVSIMIEAMADGGVKMGLTREQASQLALQTFLGTAALLQEQGLHPAVLRDQVASAGGTTIFGIHALEKGGIRASIISAIEASTQRAREMLSPG